MFTSEYIEPTHRVQLFTLQYIEPNSQSTNVYITVFRAKLAEHKCLHYST